MAISIELFGSERNAFGSDFYLRNRRKVYDFCGGDVSSCLILRICLHIDRVIWVLVNCITFSLCLILFDWVGINPFNHPSFSRVTSTSIPSCETSTDYPKTTLQGTNISPKNGILKMISLFKVGYVNPLEGTSKCLCLVTVQIFNQSTLIDKDDQNHGSRIPTQKRPFLALIGHSSVTISLVFRADVLKCWKANIKLQARQDQLEYAMVLRCWIYFLQQKWSWLQSNQFWEWRSSCPSVLFA